MAEKNESYNRCIEALRTRYRGRAVANNMKNETASYEASEAARAALSPESYILFDSRTKIADSYRSGEYNGSKYMTSDDFVRYFKSRRAFYMPKLNKTEETKAEAAENFAVPARRNSSMGMSRAESGSKEGHIQGLISRAKELAIKWFPIERREDRGTGRRLRVPVSALAGMAVFAISMTLIVSGSVMAGDAASEVGRLDSRISSLKSEKAELEGELALKYTVDEVERDVKELGMVKRQYAESRHIVLEGDNKVVVYEEEEKTENNGLASLLSAFGISFDD